MVLHLYNEVDHNLLGILVNALNLLKSEEILTIYFTCPSGGYTDVGEAIIDLININKDKINLILYGEIFSTGMLIFLKTKCSKKLLPDTRGMYHFSWQGINMNEAGKPITSYDEFSLIEMKKSKIRSLEFIKSFSFNEKEKKAIKQGQDVYLSYDRMKELL